MATSTAPAERMLNLLIALLNTEQRLSKDQIRRTVAGYGEAGSDDAFERMFERDKDLLRELGIPVVTIVDKAHGDEIGYRIDADDYALPPVELTAEQLGVLAMAAQFWQDKVLSTDAGRALTKMRAVAAAPAMADLLAGVTTRLPSAGKVVGVLLTAIEQGRPVRFDYRAAYNGAISTRTVEPWKLLARRGGWVLLGFDRDRQQSRSFRLTRLVSDVTMAGPAQSVTPPEPSELEAALAEWQPGAEQTAVIAVAPGRAAGLRVRAVPPDGGGTPEAAPDGADVIRVPFHNEHGLVDELLGYGDSVVVIGPPALRAAIIHRLTAAARLAPAEAAPAAAAAATTEDTTGVQRG